MKYIILFFFGIITMSLSMLHSEVLELGTSDVRAERDQPQALTIISRAKTDDSVMFIPLNNIDKIKEEIKNDIFLCLTKE